MVIQGGKESQGGHGRCDMMHPFFQKVAFSWDFETKGASVDSDCLVTVWVDWSG